MFFFFFFFCFILVDYQTGLLEKKYLVTGDWSQSTIERSKAVPLLQMFVFASVVSYVALVITETCLFKYTENFTTKKWKFSDKKILYFTHFWSKQIVGTRWGGSNEYPRSMV